MNATEQPFDRLLHTETCRTGYACNSAVADIGLSLKRTVAPRSGHWVGAARTAAARALLSGITLFINACKGSFFVYQPRNCSDRRL